MKKQKEPGGEGANHTPGGNFLPIFQTVYKKHPYIAILLAIVFLGLPYWSKLTGSIVRELRHGGNFANVHRYSLDRAVSPSIYQSSSTEITGQITGPSSNKAVPYTPSWEGSIDNLPDDRELYLSIENSKHELYMYKTHALNGRFSFRHHLGNKYQDVGQDFWVRLFVPVPGTDVHEGCQEFPPAGQYVSLVKKYLRRSNLPGEK